MSEIIRTPAMIAGEINAIKEQVRSTAFMASVEIGRRLREAKAMVPEGEWTEWLEGAVDYSIRTAQNLMALASEYESGNAGALTQLNYTKAVMMLAVPRYEREDFLSTHDVDAMSTRELKNAICDLQDRLAGQQLEMGEMVAQTERAEAERLRADNEKLRGEIRNLERTRSEWKKQDDLLREKLSTAMAGNTKELNAAKKAADEQRKAHEAEVAALREELEQAKQAAAKKNAEPPEEMLRELEALRKRQNMSQQELTARACWELCVSSHGHLMAALGKLREADAEKGNKFAQAFAAGLNSMARQLRGEGDADAKG